MFTACLSSCLLSGLRAEYTLWKKMGCSLVQVENMRPLLGTHVNTLGGLRFIFASGRLRGKLLYSSKIRVLCWVPIQI